MSSDIVTYAQSEAIDSTFVNDLLTLDFDSALLALETAGVDVEEAGIALIKPEDIIGRTILFLSWTPRVGEFGPYHLCMVKVKGTDTAREVTGVMRSSASMMRTLDRIAATRMEYNRTNPDRAVIVNAGVIGTVTTEPYEFAVDKKTQEPIKDDSGKTIMWGSEGCDPKVHAKRTATMIGLAAR